VLGQPSQAVFLSYASQDTDAAQRICAALRAFGIEVWFDQSELRGGDAWDQKIRQQIRDCALFVPIVSANTAARSEGYFRAIRPSSYRCASTQPRIAVRTSPIRSRGCSGRVFPQARLGPHSVSGLRPWSGCPRGSHLPRRLQGRHRRVRRPHAVTRRRVGGGRPSLSRSLRVCWRRSSHGSRGECSPARVARPQLRPRPLPTRKNLSPSCRSRT
jgi:hypothetical protein